LTGRNTQIMLAAIKRLSYDYSYGGSIDLLEQGEPQ
jgi:hypothetical protein